METTKFNASNIQIGEVNAILTDFSTKSFVELINIEFESNEHKQASFSINRKQAKLLIKQLNKQLNKYQKRKATK